MCVANFDGRRWAGDARGARGDEARAAAIGSSTGDNTSPLRERMMLNTTYRSQVEITGPRHV